MSVLMTVPIVAHNTA